MIENSIATSVLDSAFKVHRRLGPGLLESSYHKCLEHELNKSRINFRSEVGLPLVYEDVKLELGYRIDLLVESRVIVEIKSVDAINDVHMAQLLTYLKLNDCRLGLLLNFNVAKLKYGIKRVILS